MSITSSTNGGVRLLKQQLHKLVWCKSRQCVRHKIVMGRMYSTEATQSVFPVFNTVQRFKYTTSTGEGKTNNILCKFHDSVAGDC